MIQRGVYDIRNDYENFLDSHNMDEQLLLSVSRNIHNTLYDIYYKMKGNKQSEFLNEVISYYRELMNNDNDYNMDMLYSAIQNLANRDECNIHNSILMKFYRGCIELYFKYSVYAKKFGELNDSIAKLHRFQNMLKNKDKFIICGNLIKIHDLYDSFRDMPNEICPDKNIDLNDVKLENELRDNSDKIFGIKFWIIDIFIILFSVALTIFINMASKFIILMLMFVIIYFKSGYYPITIINNDEYKIILKRNIYTLIPKDTFILNINNVWGTQIYNPKFTKHLEIKIPSLQKKIQRLERELMI